MMFRFTYNTLVYGQEPIELGIARLAKNGYDGVEFIGEPSELDAEAITRELARNGMVASSVVSIYTPARDLVSSNPDVRAAALAYVRGNVDFASQIGAEVVTFTPTACMKITPEAALEQEWAWAVESARAAGRYAADRGVTIVVEPWNRYETYLINRADQAVRFVDEVAEPNVGVMLDIFHMSIEESDLPAAIRSVGHRLMHVHLADSNRAAPGQGHLDFVSILQAVLDTGYDRWLSYELLPAAGDGWSVLAGSGAEEFLDEYTASSIAHSKRILAGLGVR
jgi:sugar phosphate isomerase/epimerase